MNALERTHRARVYLAKEKVVVGLTATVGFCAVAALGLLGVHSGKMATLSAIAAIGGSFLGGAGFCMLAMGIADLKSADRELVREEEEVVGRTWHSSFQDSYSNCKE